MLPEVSCYLCSENDGEKMYKHSATKYICRKCNTEKSKRYRNTEEGRKKFTETKTRSEKRYPEKVKARWIVNDAVKRGVLKKDYCFCGLAGDAHHEDYSKPLEVEWLCRKHHAEKHH